MLTRDQLNLLLQSLNTQDSQAIAHRAHAGPAEVAAIDLQLAMSQATAKTLLAALRTTNDIWTLTA